MTSFVQSFADLFKLIGNRLQISLGIILSPTFAICNVFTTSLPFHHTMEADGTSVYFKEMGQRACREN